MITSMLQPFHFFVQALLGPGATLSFVSFYVDKRLNMFLYILVEPFSVYTLVGDSILAKRVYRNYPILLLLKVTSYDFVEIELIDFDVILIMDWLYACYASIDYSP